jgi:hypothetical protein
MEMRGLCVSVLRAAASQLCVSDIVETENS